MSEQLMLFMIGDVYNDGHGKYEAIPMKVSIQNQDNLKEFEKELENAENLIKEKFDIDLSDWFVDYEDNVIPHKDVEKLKQLDFDYYCDDNNEMCLCGANEYFNIWKQLVEKVNSNIKIEKVEIPSFYGKCTGYGLY